MQHTKQGDMTMAISKFQAYRFHERVIYDCAACGKRTRDTGHGEADCGYCKKCYVNVSAANSHSDDGHSGAVVNCPQCKESGLYIAHETKLSSRNTAWADSTD